MRIWALVKRIIQQMVRDRRTLALLLIAPLFILTLMYFIFNGDTADPKLGIVGLDHDLIEELEDVDIQVKHYDQANVDTVKDDKLDGLMQKKDDTFSLILENSDPSISSGLKVRIGQAASAYIENELIDEQKDLIDSQGNLVNKIKELFSSLPPEILSTMDTEDIDLKELDSIDKDEIDNAKEKLDELKEKEDIDTTYVYGDEDTEYFDVLSPLLVGFFVFFFVFLISGIGLLKERTSGTLERLMSSPIRRVEIVIAYLIGFGLFAIIQTVIVVSYSINVLDIVIVGSVWNVMLINLLLALVALSLGILLSTFAATEFQMIQFIPVVIVPQVFFSGIFPLNQMADWLHNIAYIMPIYYGADALKSVMYKGFTLDDVILDIIVLIIFALIFIVLNVIALRRYRRL